MTTSSSRSHGGHTVVSAILFACLFAGQASLIALSPVIADVARDLDVSTAAAGQLRTVSGLAAGLGALALGQVARRIGLGRQLLVASALLGLGAVAAAAAPTFTVLCLAQVPVGVGVAVVTTAGIVAAAEWAPVEQRARVLSWALVGQPAAWIVGMPLVGVLGEHSWRYAVVSLPLAAALASGAAVLRRASDPPSPVPPASLRSVLAEPGLGRWLAAELAANTAWAGTLVYSGALFVESYGLTAGAAGVVLAVAATAYVVGNLGARRLTWNEPQQVLAGLALALAVAVTLLGVARPSVVVSTVLFSAAGLLAGARTMVSSSFGLSVPAALRPALMGARAASMQFGYCIGALAAGTALATGGYPAYGAALGTVFLAGAAVLVGPARAYRALARARRIQLGREPARALR